MAFWKELELISAKLRVWAWVEDVPAGDDRKSIDCAPKQPTEPEQFADCYDNTIESATKSFAAGGRVICHWVAYDNLTIEETRMDADYRFSLQSVPFSRRRGRKNWVTDKSDDDLVAVDEEYYTKHVPCQGYEHLANLIPPKSSRPATAVTLMSLDSQYFACIQLNPFTMAKNVSQTFWNYVPQLSGKNTPSSNTSSMTSRSSSTSSRYSSTKVSVSVLSCDCLCCRASNRQTPLGPDVDLSGLTLPSPEKFPKCLASKVRNLLSTDMDLRVEEIVRTLHNDPDCVFFRPRITPWGLFDYLCWSHTINFVQFQKGNPARHLTHDELIRYLWYYADISLDQMISMLKDYGHKYTRELLLVKLESLGVASGRHLWNIPEFRINKQADDWTSLDIFNEAFVQGFEMDAMRYWLAEHGYYSWTVNDLRGALRICNHIFHDGKSPSEMKDVILRFCATYQSKSGSMFETVVW